MRRLRYKNSNLDGTDLKLIRVLAANARISTAELARSVGLSAPSVSERVRRLEETGIIQGYSAQIDPAALGLPLAAWLRIRPVPGQLGKVADILRDLPQIVECDRVTGEDCFVARACVASVADLEALIDRIIPYAMTNTAVVQSSPVERRLPPLSLD